MKAWMEEADRRDRKKTERNAICMEDGEGQG